jgi:hypothetical protein
MKPIIKNSLLSVGKVKVKAQAAVVGITIWEVLKDEEKIEFIAELMKIAKK